MAIPPIDRFMGKVEVRPDGCWFWTGVTAGTKGRYGYFREGTRATDPKVPAHVWMYRHSVGPVPAGMEVDHLCRRKLCVNPDHLEAVTHAENMRRARLAVCRSGRHDLTEPANVVWDTHGRRRGCLVCRKEREARRPPRTKETMGHRV